MTPSYQLREAREADLESLARAALAKGEPDAVVLAARDFSTRFLVPFLLEGVPQLTFVAGDGALVRGQKREVLEPYLDRIYQTVFWYPKAEEEKSRAFVQAYRSIQGTDPGHDDALFYDGLMLLAEAVRAVGPEPGQMREYLLSLGEERPPFEGITGPISFAEERDYPVFIIRADRLPVR
jgi:ABC-type branched-subunit amino acid transport system substrate-binding protein